MKNARVMVTILFIGVLGLMWGGGLPQALAWTAGTPVPLTQFSEPTFLPVFVDDSRDHDADEGRRDHDEMRDHDEHDEPGNMRNGHDREHPYDTGKEDMKGKKNHGKKKKMKGKGKGKHHKKHKAKDRHKGKKKRKHKDKGKHQNHDDDVSGASGALDHRVAELRNQQKGEREALRQKHRAEAKTLLEKLRSEDGGRAQMSDSRQQDR